MTVRINGSYVLGALWWGAVFGVATIGCAGYFIMYIRAGNYGGAAAAGFIGSSCAVLGGVLVISVFNREH
jgi:hypothetical protein